MGRGNDGHLPDPGDLVRERQHGRAGGDALTRSDESSRASIRAALPGEAALLSDLALRSKGAWGYSPEFLEACRAELTLTPAWIATQTVFVLESAAGVLAFCTLEHRSATRVELGHLYVEPAALGRGHGRRLLAHARREAAARGYETLEIQSDPHAEAFYLGCGARRAGWRPSGSIPGRDLPLLEIDLGPA